MKIKLDENLPTELATVLTAAAHDVDSVFDEGLTGVDDARVFEAAVRDERMFLTQDLDFSDLRKFSPGTHPGIVLIRLRNPSRRRLLLRIQQILLTESIDSWAGCFVVIDERKLRVRRA